MSSEKHSSFFLTRLMLGVGLILSMVGIWFIIESRSVLNHLNSHTLPGVDMAGEIKQGPSQLYVPVLEYQASDDADAAELARIHDDYTRGRDELAKLLSKYRAYRISTVMDEGRIRLDDVEARMKEFDTLAQRFVQGPPSASVTELRKLDESFRRFDKASDALFAFKWSRATMWVDVSVRHAECAVLMTSFILGVLFLLSLGFFVRVLTGRLAPQSPQNF